MSIADLGAPTNNTSIYCNNFNLSNYSIFNLSHEEVGIDPTVVLTIPTVSNTNYNITLCLQGRITAGPNIGDGRSLYYTASYKNVAGTLSQVGTQTYVYNITDTAAATLSPGFSVSGTSILLTFSGMSGVNMRWRGTYSIMTC
jgi:hypothetical protein